jgi:hypothetical protein
MYSGVHFTKQMTDFSAMLCFFLFWLHDYNTQAAVKTIIKLGFDILQRCLQMSEIFYHGEALQYVNHGNLKSAEFKQMRYKVHSTRHFIAVTFYFIYTNVTKMLHATQSNPEHTYFAMWLENTTAVTRGFNEL